MIETRRLTKRYGAVTRLGRRRGAVTAVEDLTFRAEAGRVTGFLGPNGAGKSTTMRMVLGLDRPTGGDALIDGRPLAEHPAPLRTVGALLDAGAATERRIGALSLGMRQRLGIAAALLGDPGTLVLDEPVNGLDPDGVRWIRTLLRRLAGEGRTVLVSSHLMAEMQQTADTVVVVGRGRLVAELSIAELAAAGGRAPFRLRVADPRRLVDGLRHRHPEAVVEHLDGGELRVSGLTAVQLGEAAFAYGTPVHELTPERASLEDVFLQLTDDVVEHRAATERSAA